MKDSLVFGEGPLHRRCGTAAEGSGGLYGRGGWCVAGDLSRYRERLQHTTLEVNREEAHST